ncbi:MAG TPA: IS66 family transposase [Kofleriaceae bacterium]|nr:IS66 family transposase [Kofleriaceae bacterium]
MVSEASSSDEPEPSATAEPELRGSVLDVLRTLLGDHQERDTVLSIVGQLVTRNTDLERRFARLGARFKPSEQVSKAQLVLFLDALKRRPGPPASEGEATDEYAALVAADDELRTASGIDEGEDDDVSNLRTPPPPHQPRSPTPPAHLRRVANPIAVPAGQRACPTCGGERQCVEPHVTEVIELLPPEVIVRRDIREQLTCVACEGEPVRAPAGETVVPNGKLGLGIVASILVEKYLDGLPLHRQRDRYRRLGLDIAVSTLADQVKWCTDLLQPVWRALLAEIIDARVMHLDGTSLPVQDSEAAGGKRIGALWGYVGVNAGEVLAAYLYVSSGKKTGQRPNERGPEDILALRTGLTVADASNLFDASFERPDLLECGCNMHARRYFVKALDAGDQRAALPLAAYKRLYRIEDEIRDLDDDAKLAARRARSKPVWDELAKWCRLRKQHEPPASKLGVALRYFTNHEVALARFLDYGFLPLDNGIVERLHVRTALTRKNFLFAGSDAGGERAAIAYSIIGSCRLAGVDPREYLADVLPRLTGRIRLVDLPSLLPSRWAAQRAAATTAAAAAVQG